MNMNREELLALCNLYVRRRGLGVAEVVEVSMPPTLEIVDSYLHAEISESEKNSLVAYVRISTEDDELVDLDEATLADLEDSTN
jgi:hypothetical protein